jgi:hypothetical protein
MLRERIESGIVSWRESLRAELSSTSIAHSSSPMMNSVILFVSH